MDKWLFPRDLGENLVVNIHNNDGTYKTNFYPLPKDWRERITKNKGKDGKPSIHEIMAENKVDWYKIVIEPKEGGTEGICSFDTETEARYTAEAFKRFVNGRLFVEKEE